MKLRKLVALGMVIITSFALTACGGGKTTSVNESKASSESSKNKETDKTGEKESSAVTEKSAATEKGSVSTEGVTITLLNTKSGLEKFLEPVFKEYKEKTGVTVEMSSISEGDSPYEAIQKKYASGDAPTLAIMDCNDIVALAEEKALPLDGEKWVEDGGAQYGIYVNKKLYSFPFSLEGRGILFNKTAIEKTLGREFDETSIKTLADFTAICEELVAAGMEKPVVVSKEDWSLGAHFSGLLYEQQGATDAVAESADKFIAALKDGSEKTIDNVKFNNLMDTFDILMKYNINGKDPLAADYDMDNVHFAEGDAAFWFNGNWVWEVVSEFADSEAEFGMLPTIQGEGDAFNSFVNAVGSKQIMIDKNASEAEIQAAKDLLNWLVYDKTAQDVIANQVQAVPCFNTFDASDANKLGKALKAYADAGKTFDQYNGLPGDHWSKIGSIMQKYLGGASNREQLAADIDTYWQEQK